MAKPTYKTKVSGKDKIVLTLGNEEITIVAKRHNRYSGETQLTITADKSVKIDKVELEIQQIETTITVNTKRND